MAVIADLVVNLRAQTVQFQAGMASASKTLTGFGKVATTTGTLLKSYVPLAVAAAGAASIKMAYDFEKSFTRISTLSNASEQDIASWKNQVLELSGATAQAPQELADALFFLSSAGLEAGQVMPALEAAAKGAALGLGTTADVANITASAMNAYAKQGLTAAEVTDTLVAAVREGRAEPEEFANALGRILPIASQAGVEFDEVAASLASLSNIGLDVNEGVTAMRGLLTALIAPGKQAAETMASLGISTDEMRAAISEGGLFQALQQLQQAAGGNIDVLKKIIPNVRALTGQFGLTVQEAEKVQEVFLGVRDSTGDMEEGFARLQESDAFKLDKAINDFRVLATEIGQDLLPAVADLASALKPVASLIGQLFGAFSSRDEKFEDGLQAMLPVLDKVQADITDATTGIDDFWRSFGDPAGSTRVFLEEFGAEFDKVAARVTDAGLSMEEFNSILAANSDGLNRNRASIYAVFDAVEEEATARLAARAAAEGQSVTNQELKLALQNTANASRNAAEETRTLGNEHRTAAEAARAQKQAEDALAGGALGMASAAAGVRDALAEVNRLHRQGKTNTEEYRAAQVDLLEAQLVLRAAGDELAATMRENDASARDVRRALIDLGKDAGLTARDARKLANEIQGVTNKANKVPNHVNTRVTADTSQAREALNNLLGMLRQVSGGAAIAVRAGIYNPPGLHDGGEVLRSGLAVVHRGEVFSGVNHDYGRERVGDRIDIHLDRRRFAGQLAHDHEFRGW